MIKYWTRPALTKPDKELHQCLHTAASLSTAGIVNKMIEFGFWRLNLKSLASRKQMFQKKVSLREKGASAFQIYIEVSPPALPRGIRIKKKKNKQVFYSPQCEKNDENSTVNLSVVAGGGGIIGFVLAGYIIVNADVARCFVFFFNKTKPRFCHPAISNAASTERREKGLERG